MAYEYPGTNLSHAYIRLFNPTITLFQRLFKFLVSDLNFFNHFISGIFFPPLRSLLCLFYLDHSFFSSLFLLLYIAARSIHSKFNIDNFPFRFYFFMASLLFNNLLRYYILHIFYIISCISMPVYGSKDISRTRSENTCI